ACGAGCDCRGPPADLRATRASLALLAGSASHVRGGARRRLVSRALVAARVQEMDQFRSLLRNLHSLLTFCVYAGFTGISFAPCVNAGSVLRLEGGHDR